MDSLEYEGDITNRTQNDYIKLLEDRLKELEIENEKLKKEIEFYKSEVEKSSTPPLIEAIVMEVLEDGRVIVKSSSGPNLIVSVSSKLNVQKLRPGDIVALNQRGSAIVDILPKIYDPYIRAFEVIERPNVNYQEIGGLDEEIRELREVIELPLTNPEHFMRLGIEPPKGVLLYGPPGVGKTLLAKAVATESKATFIRLIASELAQKYVGEGARLVKEIFRMARSKAPSIIFIDEIDSIASKRLDITTNGEREIHRTMLQLLAEMDGFDPLDKVKIIGATNRIDILDPAILRPGRFDRIIEIGLPDFSGRIKIFNIYLSRMSIYNINVNKLAEITAGFTGADIKYLCTEAGLVAIRKGKTVIEMEDFLEAFKYISKKRLRNINWERRGYW